MCPPLSNAAVSCICQCIRHISIPEQVAVFLPGNNLVQISRFINCSECICHQVSFFFISSKTRFQCSTDLNFARSYAERMQPVYYRFMFLVTDSKMTYIITELDMLFDALLCLFFGTMKFFLQQNRTHRQKVVQVPVQEF